MQEETFEPAEGFRLSPQQRRLWAERQRHPGDWQRTMAAVIVEGDLDPAILESAVNSLVARHEILRTRFVTPSGSAEPLQVIHEPAWGGTIGEAVQTEAEEAERKGIEKALEQAWRLPVDPILGPALQVSLISLTPGRQVLTATMPTLVSDTVGAVNLVREIGRACGARESGTAEGEVLQYADLAQWQNELLDSEEAQIGRAYWEELRWSALPAAALPFVRCETSAHFAPEVLPLVIDGDIAGRLEELATSRGASLRTALLAIWQVLLARHGGGDLVLGVGYDGRRYAELAPALGPFARCLPFPCRLVPDLPWSDLLARVVELDTEISRWQESFAVDTLAGPVLSARFGYSELGPGEPLTAGPLVLRLERSRSYAERFTLALEASRRPSELAIELHYDAALLPKDAVALLGARFARLLESVAADPARPVGALEILPDEERLRLLHGFNPASVPLPAVRCVHELFAEQAAGGPERLALVAGERRLTYGELEGQANRLARYLRLLGAGPETRIAICLERSPDMVMALLATLKAGAAFVPIDPALPRERRELMLHDSRARLLVSAGEFATAPAGVRLVALDADAEAIARESEESFTLRVDPSCLAYVIFTSGSSGRPKGVGVEHRQLSHYVQGVLARLELPERASFATASTFSADLGYTAIFPALATGGCLHVIPADRATDPYWMTAHFRANPVDILKITPSHVSALLSLALSRDLLPRQRLVLGGEAATWDLIDRIASLAPGLTILNHYGPTESTVGVCTYRVGTRGEVSLADTVPIGRPLGHVRIHVLDAAALPVPLVGPGEVYLGGAGLSRGYLEDPCLTAERFLPDPYGNEPGARLYRTGDRARWLLSGDLEFLGRVDDQLKVRGYRVEPGEVEKVLERHPAVRVAKVVGRETAPGDTRLAAYLLVDPESAGPVHRLLQLRSDGQLRDQALFDLPSGLMVAHLNEGETRFLYREIFGERTYLRHGIQIPAGGCVLDVGASIGLFSLLASRAAVGVRVFAFEPVPQVFRALRLNAEIHGGIHAFDFGLSREARQAQITYYPHLTLLSSLYAHSDEERAVLRSFLQQSQPGEDLSQGRLLEELLENRLASEALTISLRRLSDVLAEQEIDRVDLLKIDVQKSEHDVLAGIDENDWLKIRQVVMEVHDLGGRLGEIVELLESKGFAVTTEQERVLAETPRCNVYARRQDDAAHTPSGTDFSKVFAFGWSSPGGLIEDLRRHLQEALPGPMVPSSLSLLAELPLTPNGKLDRRALPAPESVSFETQKTFEAPGTETEKKLVEIWSEVLGSRRFGIRDSFFEIGGHSLLATRMVGRVRKAFDVDLTLRDVFNDPTIAGLAWRIETAQPLAIGSEERINRLVRAAYQRSRPSIG